MNTTVSLNDLLYDGLSDPRTFQYHFNLQVVYQTWDEARQLVTLPAHLIGKAKRAWDALTNTEKASIGTAMPALIKALDKPKDTLLSMFFAEKRRDDEPLSKFAWRLQEMLLKAMPDLSPDQSAQMLRGQILNHLPEHMRALIVFIPTMSSDALLVALDNARRRACQVDCVSRPVAGTRRSAAYQDRAEHRHQLCVINEHHE